MANLTRTLRDLRRERGRAQREVERLEEAISVLEGLVGRNQAGRRTRRVRTARMGQPRRRMSAAGRRRIAAAQRARWARIKGRKAARAKRTVSAAARNRIAAAQRARWAKLKAERKAVVRAPKKPVQKVQASAA